MLTTEVENFPGLWRGFWGLLGGIRPELASFCGEQTDWPSASFKTASCGGWGGDCPLTQGRLLNFWGWWFSVAASVRGGVSVSIELSSCSPRFGFGVCTPTHPHTPSVVWPSGAHPACVLRLPRTCVATEK